MIRFNQEIFYQEITKLINEIYYEISKCYLIHRLLNKLRRSIFNLIHTLAKKSVLCPVVYGVYILTAIKSKYVI